MKIFPLLAAASICAVVSAQSPLAVIPVAPVGYFGYNAPSNNTNVYFNLAVASPVTLQAIETPLLSPAGQQGTLSVYVCAATHVGNELNQAAWTLAATGAIVGKGTTGSLATLTAASCQEDAVVPNTGFLLAPGSYGIAVRYQGVTPLLVGVGALQTFTTAELTATSGALQYTAFTSALQGPATAQGFTAWSFRGNIVYANGSAPHACAEALTYGEGCYKVHGSPHQEFTDSSTPSAAGAAAAALNGRNLTFLNTGTSYVLTQGTNPFLAPSGTANVLALGDDAETQVTLPVPFVYPGGIATDFFVHANGFISVASNNTLPNGGLSWVPQIDPFLNAPATGWWSWHDYNPAEAGSGQVKWEQVGNKLVFTWDGVESYPTTAVNPSTWQMQFDITTGQVDMVWVTIDAVGGSGFLEGDDHLVGYSPGGVSPAGPQINVTTVTGLAIPFPETFPLTLGTTAKPILGSTISLDTSNPTSLSVGVNFVCTVQIPAPGFDLGIIGAAGCPAFVDINTGVGNVISNLGLPGLSMSVNFPLPNNPAFAGLEIFSQSVWLDAAQNAAGLVVSNGLTLLLGNY